MAAAEHLKSVLDYGPASYMPETALQYFLNTKYYSEHREYLKFYEREELLTALKSNEVFSKFWTHIQEQRPDKKDYFLSLVNEDEPFNCCWVECEFHKYLKQSAFDALSDEKLRSLQNEFGELRPAQYQAALEGESKRLNCDIADVIATSLVLPWKPDHEEESILAWLPHELFGRVIHFSETLDIFIMTLVCKRWRRLIYDNCVELKKAEHAMTTHSIRCNDWMDPARIPDSDAFLNQYQMLSWCLTRWFCGVSENLETLILDHPIPYTNLADLLQSCPNLKHLRIGYDDYWNDSPSDIVPARVKLRKLEVFMSSIMIYARTSVKSSWQMNRDILVSSPALRVYKGPLDSADFFAIDARIPVTNVFNTLVVLDLEKFTSVVLEILAQIDGLQLKYLRLGSHDYSSEMDGVPDEDRSRNALHQLLPKLKKLEMLRTSDYIGVTNDTIQLMTDLELNINWTVLYHSYFEPEYINGDVVMMEKDPLQPGVLDAFRSMLLSKNPNIDLSEIKLILCEGKTIETLEALNTGFTILKTDVHGNPTIPVDELYDPKIKRRFGVDM